MNLFARRMASVLPIRSNTRSETSAKWLSVAAVGAAATAASPLMFRSQKKMEQRQPLSGDRLPAARMDAACAKWERFQKFSMRADDPYRMQVNPAAPLFLQEVSSASWPRRQAAVVKRELPTQGLEIKRDLYSDADALDKSLIWEFNNVFTEDQCLELIAMANGKGFVPALANNQGRYEKGDPRKGDEIEFDFARRDCYIVMSDSPELANYIFQILEPHLKNAPVPNGWRVDHINSFMRSLCYCKKDQHHAEHFDAMFRYPKGKYPEHHEWANARSLLTLFIYLSDLPADAGGCTAFPLPNAKTTSADLKVQPAAGRVLMFSQNLWHTGQPLLRDDAVKYVIRTEVMFLPKGA